MYMYSLRILSSVALVIGILQGAAGAQTTATVTVNATSSLGTLQPGSIGVNTPVFDPNMLDSAIPGLIGNSGWALRFPAGTTADIYNWQTNAIVPNQSGGTSSNDTFDKWMGLVKSIGATPLLTVNYGTDPTGTTGGSTSFAAQWVQYSNITKGYGVKYWEIGNEIYGNGFYDNVKWEPDLHAALDPTTYGNNVTAFAKAMKAVDPTIKIGAVLTAPGNWPDGVAPAWNPAVLTACGQSIDFVILHWYPQGPGGETDAGLLASPTSGTYSIPNMMATIKSLLKQYAGANAANIQIVASEINSVYSDPGKQMTSVVNGLFIADAMMTWLEQGAVNVDIWDLHNGSYTQGNNSSSLYGTTAYGDYGIFSNATSEEPALDTPFPSFYGMQMISHTGKPGDTMVSTTSSNSLLTTHAVLQANGNLALMMINKDPSNATTASIAVAGFKPAATATEYLYGSTSATIAGSALGNAGASFSVTVPSYSIATLILTPVAGPGFTLSASPSSLSLVQGKSGTSTIAVAPAGGFTGSVSFSISGVPSGVTASFSPASSTSSSVLTLTASSAAAAQTTVMTITGTSGSLSSTSLVSLTVTAAPVPAFSLSASPSAVSVVQGASGTSTISVTPSGGFTGSVALAASGLPSGVTASFSASSTPSTSVLTLAAAATATAGTGNVSITGSSGTLSRTLSLPVTVTAAASSGGGSSSGAGPATFTGASSSNSAWFDEDDVKLTTPSAITAMTLTVTVPAGNVSYGGGYSTVGSQVALTHSSGSNLVYTFTLASGQTIGAGSYTFASQMDGNGNTHNFTGDSWTVTYTIGGQTYTQSGVI